MKKIILALMILCSSIFAGEITVAAAANVTYALNKLVKEFNKTNPDTKVQIILGSSGKLVSQIENGAPFDIFMSADMKFPQALFDKKITKTTPVIYAQGALAMLSAKELDYSRGINIVNDSSISKIAIANPKTAPYGAAAVEAIKNAKITGIENKFVFAESISQAVTYATTAADIGFVAKSSLYEDSMSGYKENKHWITVDPKLYSAIEQGIVIIDHSNNLVGLINDNKKEEEIKTFYDFILSDRAKKIFTDYGYITK
jgi:molybdate transport system substrate-binding protein